MQPETSVKAGTSGAAPPKARLDFVDALRGAAVVFMIMWHTVDHWLQPELETGDLFAVCRLLGGMAAPLFLFLAGCSLGFKGLAAVRKGGPTGLFPNRGSPSAASQRPPPAEVLRDMVARGIEVIILGYALRLQFWAIDASGVIRSGGWRVLIPALLGITLALIAVEKLAPKWKQGVALLAGAVALYAIAVWQIGIVHPEKAASLVKVDVLQCIGASLVIAAVVCTVTRAFVHTWIATVLGIAVAFATPLMLSWVPGGLPGGVAGYIAKWNPAPGEPTMTLFPLFPWMSYTFLGVTVGAAWDRAARSGRLVHTVVAMAAFGALLALLTQEPLPHAAAIHRELPWIVQPWRVAYRVGLGLVFAGIALALTPKHEKLGMPLRTFGRTSMLVYWVHLEFAFGIAAKPVKAKLGWWEWLAGFVILTAAMYGLARWRLGPWKRWWRKITERFAKKTDGS
jgi:uncharacterized membrane protein